MLFPKATVLIAILSISTGSVINNKIEDACTLSDELRSEIRGYQPVVNKIADAIVNGHFKGDTHKSLASFTDKFGPRIVGGLTLERSIDYLLGEFKTAGLENIHTEDVPILPWIRGTETAFMIAPRTAEIKILGLGTTVGTPKNGIIADVVVVETFDELYSLPDSEVQGKIVVFAPKWVSYGTTVQYRIRGASEAAKKGAVASLIRSVTPYSIGSPHTGMQSYQKGVRKIPTACITIEDADRLLRMYREGQKITIRLRMDDYNGEMMTSRNTFGELTGSVYKNTSVVIVSGHLDSWDVGVGAMDDGGGAFISWKAIQYLKALGLRPKRTIRAAMWTGEEFGYIGARTHEANRKAREQEEFSFFIESDIGTFEPTGLDFSGNPAAACIFREVLDLMTPLNATAFQTPIDGGPDVSVWVDRGFPGASLLNKNERYFWFHHSEGDSMLLEDPVNLDKCTALFAAASYVIADLSVDFPKDVK